MRGGSLPLFAWASILAALCIACAIWTGEALEAGELAFAVVVVVLGGLAVAALNREAIHRGAPPPSGGTAAPEPVPDLSIGAVGSAVAIACAVFGLAFGHFLIYFGCGLLVLSLGRLVVELRAQRRTTHEYRTHPLPGEGAPGQRALDARELGEAERRP